MTGQPHLALASVRGQPFADIPVSAAGHFRLALLGAIGRIIAGCTDAETDSAIPEQSVLGDYAREIEGRMRQPPAAAARRWHRELDAWERDAGGVLLPLRALRDAGLSPMQRNLLLTIGLAEEDPRFADLFAQLGGERWPTAGLLLAWWRSADGGDEERGGEGDGERDGDRAEEVRRGLAGLIRLGLAQVLNPLAARSEWALRVPAPVWDSLRGEPPAVAWLRHVPQADLLPLEHYVAHPSVAELCRRLPDLCAVEPSQTLIVRGPRHNGRKTLLGGIARALGRDMLVADGGILADEAAWPQLGALAVTLNALPVVEVVLLPGENRTLPSLALSAGPLGVVSGPRGGLQMSDGRPVVTVSLPMPDADSRRAHWRAAAPAQPPAVVDALVTSAQLPGGLIRRTASSALLRARLEGRSALTPTDVRIACRNLCSARLERLARRIEPRGSLDDLVVDATTRAELEALGARCRHREALAALLSGTHESGGTGVRALFAGASGTGKTLAARLVAASLEKDLFRIDLSTTVNKYLGETEKNLDEAFAAAEELDIVLLLDEGDALLTGRTDVGSANDRYANLETNFLLQRIESFDGILLVTTNAADRIDAAFSRRMDVVIHFRPPDEYRRYEILKLHLPGAAIDEPFLQEVACRCALTGGQLRNVVQHAQLLALQDGRPLAGQHLRRSLEREYRKTGGHCPLKGSAGADGRP